ncbi:baculoviral IAP repeat-containing protein 7 isoform X2 [Odontomachus brunneus]|uniref:baculoviral IAP repeat-containing protein 7 isoform X2 n=1 Tax=Odontomachus brunneus TaxID=486640 RepID=UPI0013F1D4EA|nr:baculoviral IAP repeat-containing protein 7 isoform X2 [Odontomachus brunneus]
MNVEENRLKTFDEWPTNAAVDAARIAKAGFYYTGYGLEVQCFLCGTTVSDWNYGDQAMARHRQAQPACPFVLNAADTCNIPLVPASAGISTELAVTSSSLATRQSNVIKGNPGEVRETIVRSTNPLKDYGTVSQRLRSFNSWPISSVVSPEQLAKSGFYYLQFSDLVECIYCGGVLTKWEAGDDPDSEHRLHFPNCDFYMRYETEDEALEIPNVTLVPGTKTDMTELGIQIHNGPSNPKNATYEERLRTFVGWPTDHNQTPEMLSTAGFYYTGFQDQVRCFHCDGGLRNWEPEDDVWSEHARWFPTCTFVNLVRGQEFVKHCVVNRPPLDPKILGETPDEYSKDVTKIRYEDGENVTEVRYENGEDVTGVLATSLPTVPQSDLHLITDSVIATLLDTAPALSALEIGLSIDRVKKTLKRRMEECGITYTNTEELIQDVLHDQAMEDYNNSDASSSSFSESITIVNRVAQATNNATSTSNNVEKHDECSEINDLNYTNKDYEALQEENRRLKEARLCKICMDNDVAIAFLPCGHLATCIFCAPSLTFCPMCRIMIRASVRTFLS